MAKVNIINNSFVGKMGDIVGQRWKGLSYIKSYTKPANPRTEPQQANRSVFSLAVDASKIAMQSTQIKNVFRKPGLTLWQQRVGESADLINKGESALNIIPTVPIGFNKGYKINGLTMTESGIEGVDKFIIDGNIPDEQTELTIILEESPNEIGIAHAVILNGYCTKADKNYLFVQNEYGKKTNQFSTMKIISAEKDLAEDDIVWSNELEITNPNYEWREDTTTEIDFQQYKKMLWLYPNYEYADLLNVCKRGIVDLNVNGINTQFPFSRAVFVEKAGKMAIEIELKNYIRGTVLRAGDLSKVYITLLKVMYENWGYRTENYTRKLIEHQFETDVKLVSGSMSQVVFSIGNAQSMEQQSDGTAEMKVYVNGNYETVKVELAGTSLKNGVLQVGLFTSSNDQFFIPVVAEESTIKITNGVLRINGGTYIIQNETFPTPKTMVKLDDFKISGFEDGCYKVAMDAQYSSERPSQLFRLLGEYLGVENPRFELEDKKLNSDNELEFWIKQTVSDNKSWGIDLVNYKIQMSGTMGFNQTKGYSYAGGTLTKTNKQISELDPSVQARRRAFSLSLDGNAEQKGIYIGKIKITYKWTGGSVEKEYEPITIINLGDRTTIGCDCTDKDFTVSELKWLHPEITMTISITNITYLAKNVAIITDFFTLDSDKIVTN